MEPIEYDSDQSHKEYKAILDTLRKKGISREKIAEKLEVNKSTLTRIYNDPRPNPQRCREYIGLIKNVKEFAQYLGLTTSETEDPYENLIQLFEKKMTELTEEVRMIRESNARIEKALKIRGDNPN